MAEDIEPKDEFNEALLRRVHPEDWQNPTPDGPYNLVVVGAGTGGLVTAAAAAGLGAEVALIERGLMGGDCLNVGCVPSKALLASARRIRQVQEADAFGVRIDGEVSVDFPAIMRRMRRIRSGIAHHDSAERFAEELGVDVYLGDATFTAPNTVEVGAQRLDFSKACIATGASPRVPLIPGLDDVPYLTNETLFHLTEQPEHLAIIGAGAIGIEMAQAFARFGSRVTVLEMADGILGSEDAEAAEVVHEALVDDGVATRLGVKIKRVDNAGDDGIEISLEDGGPISCDALLLAAGRTPNVEDIGLNAAGVDADPKTGIVVNDRLQTTNPNIFAVGDVATTTRFTHAADAMARIAVRNALFMGRATFDETTVPRCIYTDPELAQVGATAGELDDHGIDFNTFRTPFSENDRSIVEGEDAGFVAVHVRDGGDAILGATLVGHGAGDLVPQLTHAIERNIGLSELADVIHPYPTRSSAIRTAADSYNRTRLTPFVERLFDGWLSLRR